MRLLKLVVILLMAAAAFAQTHPAPVTPPQTTAAPTPKPAPIPGFDIKAMDRNVDPCADFHSFACGGWMATNPIPPDKSRWGRFDELQERNLAILRDILEQVSPNDPKRSDLERKIGDYYASCMDEQAVEAAGAKPLQPELQRIAAIRSRADLIHTVAHLHSIGVPALFAFYPRPDFHQAGMVIATVDQGGLSLPDRDYYLKEDPKSGETRDKYTAHVQKVFELLGDSPQMASLQAKTVLAIETSLAKVSMDRVSRRNPRNLDNKMTVQELLEQAPGMHFTRYFTAVPVPKFETLNVGNPEFVKGLNAMLDSVPLGDWKTYLRWKVARALTPVLPSAFVNEGFNFWNKHLGGAQELEARWKRCTKMTDTHLGEMLGQPYVDRTFGVEGKQRTLKMVHAIEKAMGDDIKSLTWMTEPTKKEALAKLATVANNIGYPDKWRDYSKLQIVRGQAAGNFVRSNAFETARQLNKIGKPVDRKEWSMTPPTVNAYYRPPMNDMNFPAGILQPPFFDKNMDDAVNFGGIGMVVGHELTHGFDDQGRKYDKAGNLHDWWTTEDAREFEKRTQCLVDEYSQFVAVDDVRLNGKLTLGENTADLGGLLLSYMALQDTLAGKQQAKVDGFTPEQRFFLGYGQIWCQNVRPEESRLRAFTDPHSPGKYRVNGVVQNMPEFWKAFGCKPGQPMVRENACRVW
jgi:endothelin-converting enzyme/putative endopeptidase